MISNDDAATKKLFRQKDAAQALSEHAVEQKRFGDNRERLRAERLAREASALANKDTAPLKPKTTATRKRSSSAGKGVQAKNKT
jgi:hypothetical protein